jgi:hypothetical protein
MVALCVLYCRHTLLGWCELRESCCLVLRLYHGRYFAMGNGAGSCMPVLRLYCVTTYYMGDVLLYGAGLLTA